MTQKLEDNPQFFIVDYRILKDKRLCAFDIVCYSAICGLANNKFNYCFASNKRLAEILNCSVRNIQRALASLKNAGYIEINVKNFNTREIKTLLNLAVELTNERLKKIEEHAQNNAQIRKTVNYDWLNEETMYE